MKISSGPRVERTKFGTSNAGKYNTASYYLAHDAYVFWHLSRRENWVQTSQRYGHFKLDADASSNGTWSERLHIRRCPSYGDLDVSKNRGTPKWMVYNGKPYQNGWFGGTIIFGSTHFQPPKNLLVKVILDHDDPKVFWVKKTSLKQAPRSWLVRQSLNLRKMVTGS